MDIGDKIGNIGMGVVGKSINASFDFDQILNTEYS